MNNSTKRITYSSSLIAIGVILPIVFHFLPGDVGKVLLPIHYSAYFTGGLFGPIMGGIVGLLTPIISFFYTGMPKYPFVMFIGVETFIYGVAFGLLYYKKHFNIVISLILSMILGRIAYILSIYFIGHHMLGKAFVLAGILDGLLLGIIGIMYQLVLIPLVIKRLEQYLGKNRSL